MPRKNVTITEWMKDGPRASRTPATPSAHNGHTELGVVVGALLDTLNTYDGPNYGAARRTATACGWDLGDVIDTADERVGQKWTYFSGLAALDDRMECSCCGEVRHVVDEFTVEAHRDPTVAYRLDCGHTVI